MRRADERRAKAHPQSGARAVKDARQHVAAERIRTEPMPRARRLKHGAVIVFQGIVGREKICQQRGDNHE